jgi:hypothetical protein
MNNDARAKIMMLNGSMRCFVFGLLALIPAFGLPFAIGSLWLSGRIRAKEKLFWNAARPYRISGVVCAALGTIFWFIIVVLIAYNAANHGSSGSERGDYGNFD